MRWWGPNLPKAEVQTWLCGCISRRSLQVPWRKELSCRPIAPGCRLTRLWRCATVRTSEIVVWRLTSSQSAPDKGGAPAPPFLVWYRNFFAFPYLRGRSAKSPDVPLKVAVMKTILRQPVRLAKSATDHASQFSTRKPRTRLNSSVLAVTRVAPVVQA